MSVQFWLSNKIITFCQLQDQQKAANLKKKMKTWKLVAGSLPTTGTHAFSFRTFPSRCFPSSLQRLRLADSLFSPADSVLFSNLKFFIWNRSKLLGPIVWSAVELRCLQFIFSFDAWQVSLLCTSTIEPGISRGRYTSSIDHSRSNLIIAVVRSNRVRMHVCLLRWSIDHQHHLPLIRKTSQELRMLSRSLSDYKSLTLNVLIQVCH